jgi:type II secretory pathway component PulF
MKHKISTQQSTVFLENFVQAYTHGYTIPQVLRLVAKGSRAQADLAEAVSRQVESGGSLTRALANVGVVHARELPLVTLGEQSGEYMPVLTYIIESRKKRRSFLGELGVLLLYPSIVGVLMSGVCIFIMTAIIPSLVRVFSGMNVVLPLHTRLLIWFSEHVWIVFSVGVLSVLVVTGTLYIYFRSHSSCRMIEYIFRIPIIGGLVQNMYAQVIIRACMTALGLPISLTSSLERLKVGVDSYSAIQFSSIQSSLERGTRLSESLQSLSCIKPAYALQICFGEETGRLRSVLDIVQKTIEQENARYIKLFTKLCEPLLMIALGAGVIFIASAVLTPLYEITRHVKR